MYCIPRCSADVFCKAPCLCGILEIDPGCRQLYEGNQLGSLRKNEGAMRMDYKLMFAAVVAGLFAFTAIAEAKKLPWPPDGTKVSSGKQFDIYVKLKESKPFAATSSMLNIYSTTVVVRQTRKHGRQRFISSMESFDANLLDPSMWQVGDFNGDGFDDYRFVSGINNDGCHTWTTQIWLPKHARFTYHAKITYITDSNGTEVKSCYPQ
jgi:hypothetical protein